MDQDGKADQSANSPTSDVSIGKIMLTLCTPSDTVSGYRHVVIPFPASYKTACAEARKAFAAQMSQYTGDVALRQATQRKDGQYVWSIIHEAAWDTILEQNGEEVGVFLNDEPDKIPYNRSKIGGDSDGAILKVTRTSKLREYSLPPPEDFIYTMHFLAACVEALRTFASYIPTDTGTVSLRQAVQRMNGKYVWSIINEDAWDSVLEKKGAEIGVFLPDASPGEMEYESPKSQSTQPHSRLVSFLFYHHDGYVGFGTVKVIRSFEAIQRRYGQAMWSIIPEDSWDTALEKSGEEIGVFLPDVPPESVPYQQAPKKLVRFQYIDPTDDEPVSVIKAVGALKECADFRDALCRQKGWPRYSVHYDSRMVGTEREQVFYKTRVSSPESKPDWCVLQKSDPEMFSILLAKHSEPMAIYLAPK
ncbi:hypothetical protein D9619_002280 [Psilocybe cf. subviscida]|uniref:Uncharacterized protein n=1 Tax=Psilocybe cf. subviscida TaxID=2480587 RepID=A0A8H5F2X4_9AGAR|nr:hypothetical protein D9619_002280 [Psilocybe cf. subviscida]